MAVDNSLESLLSTLTTSIESATEALPKDEALPPQEGISLFDVKNELLLSYLQNLIFLILLKLRLRSENKDGAEDALNPQDEVVKKLVELRVYLEKGVRPLENRLKYQIDKIVRAADDAARKTAQASKKPITKPRKAKSGSDSDASDADSDGTDQSEEDVDEMTYGPSTANFHRAKGSQNQKAQAASKDGIYRPPKITPVSMPTTDPREERKERRPHKSATMDEFVAGEMSTAPIAQPSIGSTIVNGGRRLKSEKERREETERRDYEESNFTRLPALTKKEMAKKGRTQQGAFGGEEWRGIGAGLDRIEKLTQKKGGNVGSLGKSRKRPVEDGPRGGGSAVGDAFEKRRKVVSRYK
jgi:U3 small nucleolar ribonucleoprotein protein LCP5